MVETANKSHSTSDVTSSRLEQAPRHAIDLEISMLEYAKEVSTNGLNDFLERFIKNGESLNGQFCLKGILGKKSGDIGEHGNGYFSTDGQYTFALGITREQDSEPLWLAITSFATGELSARYISELNQQGIDTDCDDNLPLILQLQGPNKYSYDKKGANNSDAIDVLSKMRWEKALLAILIDWAEQNDIPALFLLPSSMNIYGQLNSTSERLYLRYDVTAKRMGFKRQGEGFFKREIVPNSS